MMRIVRVNGFPIQIGCKLPIASNCPCSQLTDSRKRSSMDDMLHEHNQEFKRSLRKASARVKQELEEVVGQRQQKELNGNLKSTDKGDLPALLSTMSLEELSAYVGDQKAELHATQADLIAKRSKGFHKISAKSQKFASEFDRFLNAYSGIVQVVMLVDAQYGGVACATLALLFAVRASPHACAF
jgi:hypothetical protein